jgi:hypothetical protein
MSLPGFGVRSMVLPTGALQRNSRYVSLRILGFDFKVPDFNL